MSTVLKSYTQRSVPAVANTLLAALPDEEYRRLRPELESVHLKYEEVVYERGDPIRYVYFPRGAVASLLTLLEDGTTVEVGMVGRHGLIGASVALEAYESPFWTVVQVEGEAMRMRAAALKSWCLRCEPLRRLLTRHYHALVTQFCQRAVCNCRHMHLQRLCTWLLMMLDRVGADELPLTHDLIARRLGARRATVTQVYNQLQSAGAVSYIRGRVAVLDRRILEDLSCECYAVMSQETGPGAAVQTGDALLHPAHTVRRGTDHAPIPPYTDRA